jgi:ketosteroid isomerase-like protein
VTKAGLSLAVLSFTLSCFSVVRADDSKQQIVQLEQQLTEALSRSDSRTIEALWADDLVWIGPNGRSSSKAEQLAGMRAATAVQVLTAINKRVDVRIYGTTAVAVVTSTWADVQAGSAGSAGKHSDYVATHVWNRTGDSWRLVAAHISRLVR